MSKRKSDAESEPPAAPPLEVKDIILKGSDEDHFDVEANLLLQDIIHLHHVLYALKGKTVKKETELDDLAKHLVLLLKRGKPYELAGTKDVPRPFLKSQGRLMMYSGDNLKELSDDEAKKILRKKAFEEFTKVKLGDLTDTPYKEYRDVSDKMAADQVSGDKLTPEPKDAVLFRCSDVLGERLYEFQSANKVIFNLAAQLVTSQTNNSEGRVKAALMIINGLNDADVRSEDNIKDMSSTHSHSRFLVRDFEADLVSTKWTPLDADEAAEFAVTFAFEVFLEKESHLLPKLSDEASVSTVDTQNPSKDPIKEPTEYDVLFGRGGMTNSHSGNRRFRDIISLHRPDYIRAIKMDKPAVAKKIVKAIRMGNPPGRFLKKSDDGFWYDVGDRTASEKTSQGLRERSNAEKRQRSELRRALRIRKEDMEEDDESSAKRAKKSGPPDPTATAALTNSLNYVGTNLGVPLSLSMAQVVPGTSPKKKTPVERRIKSGVPELDTEGLPPNAVDEEGNILVTDYDILCGRGGLTNHHKGNKRFRDIVALHRPDYVRAPKIQKPSVARVIVRAIRNGDPPGRFLKKDEKTGKWYDVGDKKAAEKTSQALREKSNEERDNIKEGKDGAASPGGALLPNPASYLAATTANVIGSILASGGVAQSNLSDTNEAVKDPTKPDDKVEDDGKPPAAMETADV